jgi:hypothetical protein
VSSRTLRIRIDASVDGEEIRGQIGAGAGETKPFSGWLGLLAALDLLLGNSMSDAGVTGTPDPRLTWED